MRYESTMDGAFPETETTARDGAAAIKPPRRRWRRVAVFLVATLLVLLARPASHHVRAATLLTAFSDPAALPEVSEELLTVDVTPDAAAHGAPRSVRARLYAPRGQAAPSAPAVVMVHGVHRLGIEEPRLQRFARAVAGAGVVVLTPEIEELSDYHVAARSIDTVGAAARALRRRVGSERVGLMGMSFGGGVALLTAAEPRFADEIAFVVAIGAHDDLARVSRFFATGETVDVGGTVRALRAHEYGATVLVYTHIEDFFPAEDVPAAREALRLWLWEQRGEARKAAAPLSPASKERIERLFAADVAAVRPELLAEIERREIEMKLVSPHARLGTMKAHAYLLHGEGDNVIPATETSWLAREVPEASLRAVLVSPAIAHVELKEPTVMDKWALVHFMGLILGEAERSR
jgi:dienelactone hydrolase